jgi:hypothetical protein
MAVRTISDAGGNYNSTGTWVGGVVPISIDTIATTATSGPLTINVPVTTSGVDFTNYTSTLTINSDFTISGPVVLVNTMIISGTAYMVLQTTSTIRTNGLTIPWLRISGTNISRTMLDNLTVTNLLQSMGNQNPSIAGSFTMSVTNFRTTGSGGGSYGWLTGTRPIVFNGANCYYENTLNQCGILAPMFINTPGNFTVSGTASNAGFIALATLFTGGQLTYQTGTLAGTPDISIFYNNLNNTTGLAFDTGSASWRNIFIKDVNNQTGSANIVNLISPLRFQNMIVTPVSNQPYTTARMPLRFTGTSVLQGGTFSAQSVMMSIGTTNVQTSYPATIQFTPNAGTTHSFTNLNIVGMPGAKSSIASTTGVRVGLSFSNVLLLTDVTNVQAQSTSYVYGGSMSNAVNFSAINFGGGGSSYTFVN